MNTASDRHASGFALLLVLWILMLLSLLGLSLMRESSAARVQADTDFTTTRARLILDGAINRALTSLLDPFDPNQWSLDGTPQSITLGGEQLNVVVESETGKFDLNTTSGPALKALLATLGIAQVDAETIVDRIVVWRSRSRSGDDPDSDYRLAGRLYGPRLAPFRSVGELRLVLGMTDALQASLEPIMTVYSGSSGIDRSVASESALRLLSNTGDALAESQLSARAAGQAVGANRLAAAGEVVTIRANFMSRGITQERHAAIRIGRGRQSFRVLAWQ